MLSGSAAFPGVKDASDQIDKIWRVLGNPDPQSCPALVSLPNFKSGSSLLTPRDWVGVALISSSLPPDKSYPPQRLVLAFPRLSIARDAEDLAQQFLQLDPRRRISAAEALHHPFFSVLPDAVYRLPPSECSPAASLLLPSFSPNSSLSPPLLASGASIFSIDGISLSPEVGSRSTQATATKGSAGRRRR